MRTIVALMLIAAASGSVAAQAAGTAGELQFLRCKSCHDIKASAGLRIGPPLGGIVGRKAASVPGYQYSAALKAQTFVWDTAALDKWLTRPTALVPGTKMAFAGMPNPADRKALIDYLKTAK